MWETFLDYFNWIFTSCIKHFEATNLQPNFQAILEQMHEHNIYHQKALILPTPICEISETIYKRTRSRLSNQQILLKLISRLLC